jgi:hypothetical protein
MAGNEAPTFVPQCHKQESLSAFEEKKEKSDSSGRCPYRQIIQVRCHCYLALNQKD